MNYSNEYICMHILMQLKKYLHSGGHCKEEKDIDYILCQYHNQSILVKRQFLEKLAGLCQVRAYGDLFIPDIEWNEWLAFLSKATDVFKLLLAELEREVMEMPLSEISYNDKIYKVFSDATSWIIRQNVLVFLLKDNNEYFQDNIVAVDWEGNYLWSSKDVIDVKNRDGAVFVSLGAHEEDALHAIAWVGVNYELDIRTGRVLNAVITK